VRGTAIQLHERFGPTMPRGEFVLVVRGVGKRRRRDAQEEGGSPEDGE